jgi:hypothetical protein
MSFHVISFDYFDQLLIKSGGQGQTAVKNVFRRNPAVRPKAEMSISVIFIRRENEYTHTYAF